MRSIAREGPCLFCVVDSNPEIPAGLRPFVYLQASCFAEYQGMSWQALCCPCRKHAMDSARAIPMFVKAMSDGNRTDEVGAVKALAPALATLEAHLIDAYDALEEDGDA